MRQAGKPATLKEMFGADAEEEKEYGLADIKELLGEQMPKLDLSRVGKIRLMRAFEKRFGPGFKNLKPVEEILEEFDEALEAQLIIEANKGKRV